MALDFTKMTHVEIYHRGFIDGCSAKENYKVSLLGYDLNKLIEIVRDWESRQSKLLYKLEKDGKILEVYKHSEGHVVWADGKIIYKSWEPKA